ncbi:hypothetical protein C483_05843 [Natrialba hulunbeirensis JCM 10989]|uniref:DUF1059 domain-containing protein n=1 Tax=Natrialba hulunbeirensis JCM 10989 TaxID=1227493 RepID=M0A6E9_9EURY|nr:hypothetical protein [Natrialba hulunbeirensis]ELY93462.1 hypothetical protein C483_05843 [Natrialba hulunbeirensis JCM 10989]
MTENVHDEETMTALQVACDTAVSGCVFTLRTEEDDRERLLEITRDHVAEQHGKEFTLEEIEEQHVETVSVPVGEDEHEDEHEHEHKQ